MKTPFAYRALAASAILGLSIAGLTACSSGVPPSADEDTTPTASASSAAPAAPSKVAPTVDPKLLAAQKRNAPAREESIKLLKGKGIEVTDKLITTPKGKYPQVSVTKSSEYAKFNKSKHTGGLPTGWTTKDADGAQRFGMNYMLQDMVDSSITGIGPVSKKAKEAWVVSIKKKWHPKWISTVTQAELEGVAFAPDWFENPEFLSAGYTYPYDEVTPRVRSVELTKVMSQVYKDQMYFEFEGKITMNTSTKDNPRVVDKVTWTLGFGVDKTADGYGMSGFRDHWQAYEETMKLPAKTKG